MSIDAGTLQPVGLFTGQHVLAELEGVDPGLLDDEQFLRDTLHSALSRSRATVCQVIAKRFEPQGVTVLALLSESHASLHTYPEDGSIFIDVFTCGYTAQPERAVQLLAEALRPSGVNVQTIRRGRDYGSEFTGLATTIPDGTIPDGAISEGDLR